MSDATTDPADADDFNPAAGTELERQRQRSLELQEQLDVLRRSESFRIGQALTLLLRKGRLRSAVSRLRGGADAAPRALGPGGKETRGSKSRPKREWTAGSVLFVCLGPHGREAVEQIRSAMTMLVAIRPILLADVDPLDGRVGADFPVEHVISLDRWCEHRPAGEWGAYVSVRVSEVMVEHRVKRVVIFPPPSGAFDSLSAVLAPVFLPQMAISETNLLHD